MSFFKSKKNSGKTASHAQLQVLIAVTAAAMVTAVGGLAYFVANYAPKGPGEDVGSVVSINNCKTANEAAVRPTQAVTDV